MHAAYLTKPSYWHSIPSPTLGREPDEARGKLVGVKIHELTVSFRKLTDAQRAELAAQAETELKIGLAQLIKDKTQLKSLLDCVDPPASPLPAQ